MWTTGIFVAEMLGVFTLTFLTLFVVLASKSSVLALSKTGKKFFVTIAGGVALVLAIVISFGVAKASGVPTSGYGYVNPASAIADAIAKNNYKYLLPAISGALAGAVLAGGFVLGIFTATYRKSPVAFADAKEAFSLPTEKKPSIQIVIGETLATFMFLGVVLAVGYSKESINESVILIGAALTLINLTFGLRFNIVINTFSALVPMLFGLIINKYTKANLKNGIKNITVGGITNLGIGALLGLIYFGF